MGVGFGEGGPAALIFEQTGGSPQGAIAYEITTSLLRRKPESKVCRMLYFLNETTEFWLWILAKAGMTGTKPPICNSPELQSS